jgi:hypothetical protein
MVALYELEERTGELLDRLGALGIDTGEATIVRVELDNDAALKELKAAAISPPQKRASVPTTARYAITGAVIGSSILFLIGVPVYEASLLDLGMGAGLFGHSIASALCGFVLGSGFGWLTSAFVKRAAAQEPVRDWARLNRDGFLVAIKMPPKLAEQAEEIARRLGAKEILL